MESERYIMMYNVKNSIDKLRILGKEFVENNKNKGKLIIHNKKYCLTEFNPIINYNKKELKINILLNQNNFNKSCMFMECFSLISVSIYENNKHDEINNNKEFIEEEEEYLEDKYFAKEIKNFSTEKISEVNTYSQYSFISEKNEDISDIFILIYIIRNLSLYEERRYGFYFL